MYFVNSFGMKIYIEEDFNKPLRGKKNEYSKSKWNIDLWKKTKKNRLNFFLEDYKPKHLHEKQNCFSCRIDFVKEVYKEERARKKIKYTSQPKIYSILKFFSQNKQELGGELKSFLLKKQEDIYKAEREETAASKFVDIVYSLGPKIEKVGKYGVYDKNGKLLVFGNNLFQMIRKYYIPNENMVVKRHYI